MDRETHVLFFQFSCGHEYFMKRRLGGDGWENCLCDSCQPFDGVLSAEHPCCLCGGSLAYFKDGLQTRLSEAEVRQKMTKAIPFFLSDSDTEKYVDAIQSS